MNATHFQVNQLRLRSLVTLVEALLVSFVALIASAILPALLLRYVYAGQQLLAQPKVLEYLPLATFVVIVGYFLYAMVSGFMREMSARKLEKQLAATMMACGCDECGCDTTCSHDCCCEPGSNGMGEKASKSKRLKK